MPAEKKYWLWQNQSGSRGGMSLGNTKTIPKYRYKGTKPVKKLKDDFDINLSKLEKAAQKRSQMG